MVAEAFTNHRWSGYDDMQLVCVASVCDAVFRSYMQGRNTIAIATLGL